MPAALSYPGVYVEEIPSGVRTITAVPTSVTAFIGRTLRGPRDEATDITSYADFERTFGGLWLPSPMTFAVRDFFLNGGGRAVVVRLFHASFASDDLRGAATQGAAAVADAAATKTSGKDAKAEAVTAEAKIAGDTATDDKTAAKKKAAKEALNEINKLDDGADDKAVKAAAAKAKQVVGPSDTRSIAVDTLKFKAASPGKWGGFLRVEVEAAAGEGAKSTAREDGLEDRRPIQSYGHKYGTWRILGNLFEFNC